MNKLLIFFTFYILPFTLSAGEIHEFKLDNGLKIIVKEDHRAPVVVSQVWYKVGSSYEQTGKTGLSHMFEHMMFKGTKKYKPNEFSRIMAKNGARENAFTSNDYTAYFQRIEKSRLEICFELEADRMRNLLLKKEEFEKERKVVMEERRMRTDDKPISLTNEAFYATVFKTSPYRNPTIGWMYDLENLTLDDMQNWYERWYAPNNAILVVVGDVEPKKVFDLAKKHFGVLKPSENPQEIVRPEVKQFGIQRITVKRPAKLPYLTMGYKVPVLKNLPKDEQWEAYALELLAYVLDGGNSARFEKNLVRGQEIATMIGASYDLNYRLNSLFSFYGIPAKKYTVVELENAIHEQIKLIQEKPVAQEELERIKVQLKTSKIYEQDSLFYQGMQIGMLEAIGVNNKILDEYLPKISAITPAQIQAVARKYFIDDSLTIAVLEPLALENKKADGTK
jgi:zinc protease